MSIITRLFFWILIIAVIAVSSLWIMGGKRHEYSTSLMINSDPATIFSFLVESDRIMDWSEGVIRVGKLESNFGDDGHSKRITTERVVSKDGQEITFVDEVLRFDQDKSLSIQSTHPSIVVSSTFKLTPKGEQTEVIYRVKTLHCGFGRLLAPFGTDSPQPRIERELRQLKDSVESNSVAGNGL